MDYQPNAVVIGASAGALESLYQILPSLPPEYRLPIIIVVHIPPDKKSIMADLLQSKCAIRVVEAQDKEPLQKGTAYIAPPDYHVLVEKNGRLSLSSEEPVLYSRPSIDVLFETASDAYGSALIGVILSGANSDGVKGLKSIINAGGTGIVLDPDLAYAPTMPQAAQNACPTAHILNFEQITDYLQKAALSCLSL